MLDEEHTFFYELKAVNRDLLVEKLCHVNSEPLTKQQLMKLREGAGATVSEWPTIGIMMIEDPVSKKKADDILQSVES